MVSSSSQKVAVSWLFSSFLPISIHNYFEGEECLRKFANKLIDKL
jgi:hypothetical protein